LRELSIITSRKGCKRRKTSERLVLPLLLEAGRGAARIINVGRYRKRSQLRGFGCGARGRAHQTSRCRRRTEPTVCADPVRFMLRRCPPPPRPAGRRARKPSRELAADNERQPAIGREVCQNTATRLSSRWGTAALRLGGGISVLREISRSDPRIRAVSGFGYRLQPRALRCRLDASSLMFPVP